MMRTSIVSFVMMVLPFLLAGKKLPVTGRNSSKKAISSVPQEAYQGMRWRFVGPYRAGWATVAEGIPDKPNVFYFGSAGGGIWKTTDAGRTWKGLMQHQEASAVGALAIAPSNPKIIYVGTGQVTIRYDNMAGNGIYRSSDGGKTWENVGLKDTRHIGRILVDPHDPNHVIVAALGHVFNNNSERGVFVTHDGGQHWKKVLYVNDKTGAVDLAWDPLNPKIVYAAMWQMRLHPWLDYFQPQAGPGSWIYKSTDGGEHWKKIPGKGLPTGSVGRIGIAVPRGSNGKIVYATVAQGGYSASGHAGSSSGFFRSDDGGKTFKLMNTDPELTNNYFCRITVAPDNPNHVYVMGRSIHYSTDGGRHFMIFKGSPGGDDYHFMWINPKYPNHMISGADQGAAVTLNDGKSWSSWYNQPTGQFYHIAVDNRYPFHIYSGQQDNGTVDIASQGPYGVIEERDWHPVGGDERDYMVPKPGDPTIVFGSGLGGHVSRFNDITRQVANVSPWPVSSYGAQPTSVKYHYTWITPLVFSHVGNDAMYMGSQVLFKSTDNGDNWSVVSPDMSGKTKVSGDINDPTFKQAFDDGFGVIYTISPSPVKQNVIWTGNDNGLIHVTTDGGKHWKNVTPKSIPLWGKIDAISPSPFNTETAYVDVDLHRIGKFSPMLLKTTDGGKNWTPIDNGIPSNEYTTVILADPHQKGLLFAGTDRSVYVSFDNGAKWQPLSFNFPTTWVRDLKIRDNDLVAGTQGRGIWIMDDLEPLRELAAGVSAHSNHLFKPAVAIRNRGDENKDTPPPPSTPLGKNPPAGAIIDYYLSNPANGPVTLTIRDSEGNLVRQYASNKQEHLPADRYFQKGWLGSPHHLSTKSGMHRFVWNLRYTRPEALQYSYSIAGVWDDHTPLDPEGPLVVPGNYRVTLKVDGKSYTKTVTVKLDPRVHVSNQVLQEQLKFAQQIDNKLNESVKAYKEIEQLLKEKKGSFSSSNVMKLNNLAHKGKTNFASVSSVFAMLTTKVEGADAAPNQGQHDVYNHYNKDLEMLMQQWHQLKSKLH